jgi:hypothetical protein
MRLTLRTLLAYLDDTLEPSQAKVIGQKVAESDTAQELIARIKQVTRRRRLTNPPPSGTTNIDPNTLAEYLENSLDTEQLDKVEQICLASDANLAELATCHQILTQIQVEQSLVPPTSRQRMYGLVKGREAIPFRKPPQRREVEPEEPLVESREEDETLRLGLPLLRRRGGWAQTLALVGGGLALVALLALAIFQVLHVPAVPTGRDTGTAVALNKDKEDKKAAPKEQAAPPVVPNKGVEGKPPVVPKDKQEEEKPGAKKDNTVAEKPEPAKEKADKKLVTKAADEAPSDLRAPAGNYRPPEPPASSLLLQGRDGQWQRVALNKREVFTADPLLSLPGYRSTVDLANGVRLTLWGHLPELFPETAPLRESEVVLHASKRFDLDLTLRRGRILVTNAKPAGSAQVRVRFDNPTNPDHKEFWDLTLQDKGAEVLLEKSSTLPPDGKFRRNAKDRDRLGPPTAVALVVREGQIRLKVDDVTYGMDKPPGPALFVWTSDRGPGAGPYKMDKLPDPFLDHPSYPKKLDAKARTEMEQALRSFADTFTVRLDAALRDAASAPDSNRRKLAVNGLGAIDDVDFLLEKLADEKHPDVRVAAIDALRFWLAEGQGHDLLLYARAAKRFSERQADILLPLLLFNYSPAELNRPDTYQDWIDLLINSNLAIRQVAAWHLYQVVPAGQKIAYNAAGDRAQLERARQEWRALIPRGQLPPAPAKK